MLGLIGRARIVHLPLADLRTPLELIVQRNCFALTEGVNRGAHTAKSKTGSARNELPGGERLSQSRSNDAVGNEDDSGNDHCRRQKESDGPQAVAELRAVAVEE